MTRKIYKYKLADSEESLLERGDRFDPVPVELVLSDNSSIIHFDFQNFVPTIWVQENSKENNKVIYRFLVVGTGWSFPDEYKHVKTWLSGPYVWHLLCSYPQQVSE